MLVTQQLPNALASRKDHVSNVEVVPANAEFVMGTAGKTLAAYAQAAEDVGWIRFAVRSPEASKQPDAFARMPSIRDIYETILTGRTGLGEEELAA